MQKINPFMGMIDAADFNVSVHNTGVENSTNMQAALDYCFDNNYALTATAGRYDISLPLIVKGRSGQTAGAGNTIFRGQGREAVTFRKVDDSIHTNLPKRMQKSAAVIISDPTMTGAANTQARNLDLSGFAVQGVSDALPSDYGFYCPTGIVESKFADLMTQYNSKAFWTDGGDIYLCKFDRFRLSRCDYGFYTNGGVNTSISLNDFYVVSSRVSGIKLQATYSQINNPAIDSAKGICYDLDNFRGAVIAPGCESKDADIVFNFKGATPAKGNAVIIGAHTNAITSNPDGVHIQMGVNSAVFMGGHINTHDASSAITTGRLVEFKGVRSVPSTLRFIGTRTNAFSEMPRNPRANCKVFWEDWDMNHISALDNIQKLLSTGNAKTVNGQLHLTTSGTTKLRRDNA